MLPAFLRPELHFLTTFEIVRAPRPVKLHLTARETAAGLVLLARGWSTTQVLASLAAQRALLASLEGK